MDPSDDLQLARRAAAGDRGCFDAIFDRFVDRVHRLAVRRGADPVEAERLTERVLERLFEALPRYDARETLDLWALGIAWGVLSREAPAGAPRTDADAGRLALR